MILRESGLLEHMNDSVRTIADKAYVGEEGELTTEDKNFNYEINSARAAIENINQRIKIYAVNSSIYRGAIDGIDKITKISQIVCAVCNPNLIKHPIQK
ncbi:hypothetical protein I4U23_017043 [Adineta vaga]|nr:hypothetical protein I4U23_017043 [Adineta vaga]